MEPRAPESTPYAADALAWSAGDPAVDGARTVVCLDPAPDPALHEALAALGHDVLEPGALPDASVDVVVTTHEPPADLDEAARVLRPGGRVALLVPTRDARIPWVRKLDRILRPDAPATDPARDPATDPAAAADPVADHARFGDLEDSRVRFWQQVDRPGLLDLVARLPEVRDLPAAEREERLAAVGDLYDDYGRGHDGMQLPWVAHCFRARLSEPVRAPRPRSEAAHEGDRPHEPGRDLAADTEMLLIDFR